MRAAVVALALLAGCKGRAHDAAPSQGSSGFTAVPMPEGHGATVDAGPDADLTSCRGQLPAIAALDAIARANALLEACQPCGDWAPILRWSMPHAEGGPTHNAISDAMLRCRAYCEPNAKQRFLGALDNARAQGTRTPWRLLGETCGAAVSAAPDARHMSAPYFALDRIARAIAADTAPELLAQLTLSLPAVSISGVGVQLPALPRGASPASPDRVVLTVDASQFLVGQLPLATLSANGLVVTGDYPGTAVPAAQLAKTIAAARAADKPLDVLAPHALPVARIFDVLDAAKTPIRLVVALPQPVGWSAPGALDIVLRRSGAGPTLEISRAATVDDLVAKLATLREQHVAAVTLAPAKP